MIVVSRNGLQQHGTELRLLGRLVEDLEHIVAGHRPGTELVDAPFLDDYFFGVRPTRCLVGDVQGHPVCRGPAVATSELWACAPELGWARTYSRYYCLGRPAKVERLG